MQKVMLLGRHLFASIPLSIFLMALYAACIGWATFVERDYGTLVANDVIYQSWWFEGLNIWLLLNLLGCLRQCIKVGAKIGMLIFHFSFVVIIIGAGLTRFFGFEGNLVLKNGESSAFITSTKSFLNVLVSNEIEEGQDARSIDPISSFKQGFDIKLSPYVRYSSFELDQQVFDKKLSIRSLELINYSIQSLYASAHEDQREPSQEELDSARLENRYVASFEIVYDGVRKIVQLSNGGELVVEKFGKRYVTLSWGPRSILLPFSIRLQRFEVQNYPGSQLPSSYASYVEVDDDENKRSFEYKIFMNNVLDYKGYRFFQSSYTTATNDDGATDYTGTVLSVNKDPGKILTYIGYTLLILGGLWIILDSDSRFRQLSDFVKQQKILGLLPLILIASLITPSLALQGDTESSATAQLDSKEAKASSAEETKPESPPPKKAKQKKKPAAAKEESPEVLAAREQVRIFMQHIAELEKKQQSLAPKLKDSSEAAVQARLEGLKSIPKDLLREFSTLQLQSMDGRIKIIDTYSDEVMRKIVEAPAFRGLERNEFLLGLMALPQDLARLKFIRVKDRQILNLLGVTDSVIAFNDLFIADKLPDVYAYAALPTEELLEKFKKAYKLYHFVVTAAKKPESQRNEFDKQILKLHDKMDYLLPYSIWNYLKIFPPPQNLKAAPTEQNLDELQTWQPLGNPFLLKDPLLIYFYSNLITHLQGGIVEGEWQGLSEAISLINDYQKKSGGELYLDSMRVESELLLNKVNIFPISQYVYLLLGALLFFIALIAIIANKKIPMWLGRGLYALLLLAFIAHTIGLLLRWYIGGHAPWSNAYESMLYIAWASALAGLVILRSSYFALCGSSFLAGMALTVAHWGFMDPQIGNLQPVLQSYWLNIHVAVIVASYGFLGLSLMLGIVNLILFMFRGGKREQIDTSILSLSALNEMSMTIGVLMLSAGTFLGGVWANESWGRYWSWDSKETWSLVSIGVYACVLHLRLLRPIHIVYIFNALSVLAFYSIIMTYFGVNYYLATGLHSYSQGNTSDEVHLRLFICLGLTLLLIALAFPKRKLLYTRELYYE